MTSFSTTFLNTGAAISEPQIDWDQGLAEMVDWGQKYLPMIQDRDTGYTLRG